MSEEKFDFLVILNGIATDNGKDFLSELVELNWCSYDLSKKSVNAESSYLIRPFNIKDINHNFLRTNSINFSDLEKADDLLEVLKKFNIFIFETYTKNNFSFAIITKDDWLLGTQIKLESTFKRIKLGYHLDKYFNLIREFKKFYNIENFENSELKDLLKFLNLKQTETTRPSMMELNTLVRIVNRMIKDGHHFIFKEEKKIIDQTEKNEEIFVSENSRNKNFFEGNNDIEMNYNQQDLNNINPNTNLTTNIITNLNNNNNKNLSNISWKKPTKFFIRIKNLPLYYGKKEIENLFYLYDISDKNDINESENIVLSYDFFGRKTGEAVIRLNNQNESALNEILSSYKFRQISDNSHQISLLDVIKTNSTDYLNCLKNTKFSTKTIYDLNITDNLKENINQNTNIFVKIKNLSTSAKEESIRKFFKDFNLAENGIKLLKNKKGNTIGEAVTAFTTEEDARRAIKEKNLENFMNLKITLELSNLDEFENFANSYSFHITIKNLHDYVSAEIVQRCLYVNNLPLDINKDFLIKTFEIFNLNESNFIIDEKILRNYGCLIVIFLSEEDAAIAKNYLKKTTIRWKDRIKKLEVENLLFLVNKGNEL